MRHPPGTRMRQATWTAPNSVLPASSCGSVTFARPVTTRPQPRPPPRGWAAGLKVPNFKSGHQPRPGSPASRLFRTKDTPDAEEIWMGLGALGQKPGAEAKTPTFMVYLGTCSANTGQGRSYRSPEPQPGSARPCDWGTQLSASRRACTKDAACHRTALRVGSERHFGNHPQGQMNPSGPCETSRWCSTPGGECRSYLPSGVPTWGSPSSPPHHILGPSARKGQARMEDTGSLVGSVLRASEGRCCAHGSILPPPKPQFCHDGVGIRCCVNVG